MIAPSKKLCKNRSFHESTAKRDTRHGDPDNLNTDMSSTQTPKIRTRSSRSPIAHRRARVTAQAGSPPGGATLAPRQLGREICNPDEIPPANNHRPVQLNKMCLDAASRPRFRVPCRCVKRASYCGAVPPDFTMPARRETPQERSNAQLALGPIFCQILQTQSLYNRDADKDSPALISRPQPIAHRSVYGSHVRPCSKYPASKGGRCRVDLSAKTNQRDGNDFAQIRCTPLPIAAAGSKSRVVCIRIEKAG